MSVLRDIVRTDSMWEGGRLFSNAVLLALCGRCLWKYPKKVSADTDDFFPVLNSF